MGYVALYRQFRPKSFDSIAGQEQIVRTLKNQIKNNRISHAYLFCGPRGTGKTSAALVFAHAVNCMQNVDGDVCGECEYCMQSGENIDISEIDAASNNGVDEIRDLRETVRYMPAVGKYKVYIIDEVHMLSTGAFNALLKTLEEPPPYVIFILATTEVHKIPATIISRCQRFDFKAITPKEIANVLRGIATKMNIAVDNEALSAIARWANGGLRDAIGLFDQTIDYADGKITVDTVNKVIGTAGLDFSMSFINAIADGDAATLLSKTDEIVNKGKDLAVFAKDITNHLRNILMYSIIKSADMLDIDTETAELYKKASDKFTNARLVRAIELLSSLESELRYSAQSRIIVELTLIKVCRPEVSEDIEALRDTVEQLQKQIASGVVVQQATDNGSRAAQKSTSSSAPAPKPEKKAAPVAQGPMAETWAQYMNELKRADVKTYGFLKNCTFNQTGDDTAELLFAARDAIFAQSLEKLGKLDTIQKALSERTGKDIKITVKSQASAPESGTEKVTKALENMLGKDKVEII